MFGTRAEASAEGAKEAVYSAVFSISREAAALNPTSAGENTQFVNTSGRVDSASRSLYNNTSNNTSRKNAGIQPLRNAQATVVSTGERVKLSDAPIHAVEDGQVILNTSSGRVPLSSVRFENPQVPMIYAMAVDGYGAKTANLYINGYDRAVAYNPNMDIETYTYAFENIARKSAEVGSESKVRSELPGELSEIGEAAFLYAYGAGPAFKNAKERGKYGGEEASVDYARQGVGDNTGILQSSARLESQPLDSRVSETSRRIGTEIQRAAQQNDTRGTNGRGQKVTRRIGSAEYTYSETREEAKTERSRALQAELAELGVDSTVIDSRAEVIRNGNSSILGGEATTITDGSVLVRNDGESTAPTKRISGHEFFHVATKLQSATTFRNSITKENIDFSSGVFKSAEEAVRTVYGDQFGLVENPVRFYNEFCAFVSGDIYENGGSLSAEFASMFHDPSAVEAAWADMRARFGRNKSAVSERENASWSNRLSDDEISALNKYKSSESYKINAKLRDDIPLNEQEQRFVESLDRALSKLPRYEGTVYRNLVFDDFGGKKAFDAFMDEHIEGNNLLYDGFTSTSALKDGYPVDGQYVVRIVIADSTKGFNVDGFGNNFESEVVYARGSSFDVEHIEYDINGMPIIYLTEVNANGKGNDGQLYTQERGKNVQQMQVEGNTYGNLQRISERDSQRRVEMEDSMLRVQSKRIAEPVEKGSLAAGADEQSPANISQSAENGGRQTGGSDVKAYRKGNPEEWTITEGGAQDADTKALSHIVDEIRRAFGIPISTGKMRRPNAQGVYKTQSEAIRTQVGDDLPTIAHELGHHLDKKYRMSRLMGVSEAIRGMAAVSYDKCRRSGQKMR